MDDLIGKSKPRVVTQKVYVIQQGHYFKIGTAKDVDSRVRDLQIGCPLRHHVVCVMDGDHGLEGKLHRQFDCRRESGEWFRLSTEDLSKLSDEVIARDGCWVGVIAVSMEHKSEHKNVNDNAIRCFVMHF